jgi:hypothetical protein
MAKKPLNKLQEFSQADSYTAGTVLMNTYLNLEGAEREVIDDQRALLLDGLNQRRPGMKGFGVRSQLELIAKVGLWLGGEHV